MYKSILILASVTAMSIATAQAAPVTITARQAAHIDYESDQGMVVSQRQMESLNYFIFDGASDYELRQFFAIRDTYSDSYNPLEDCRNPALTKKQHMKFCM